MKGTRWGFIILILLIVLTPQIASAEEYEGYYSSEMILNMKGKPGDVITESIRFFNDTPDKTQATFNVMDFIYENNSIIYEEDRPISFSVKKWTSLNVDELVMDSKGYVDIELTVKIPEEAEMGEHMALLEGGFLPANSLDSEMKIKTEIAPVVYVLVTDKNGKLNLNKEWNLLGIKKDLVNGGHFTYNVQNTGNVHLESKGTMKITNLITKKVVVEEKIPRVNLLPNNSKEILINWNIDELLGVYKADIKFSMDGEKFEETNATLFMLPWLLISIVVITIILILILLKIYINRLKKKWLAEAANNFSSN